MELLTTRLASGNTSILLFKTADIAGMQRFVWLKMVGGLDEVGHTKLSPQLRLFSIIYSL